MLVALGLLATWNLHSASSERARRHAAADRVDALGVSVGGLASLDEFTLGFVITNNADTTLRLGRPRVQPATFSLIDSPMPTSVAGGSSAQLTLHLQARCPVPSTVKIGVVVPVSPPSGRLVDVAVEPDVSLVKDLAHRACGQIPPFESAQITTRFTGATTYGVSFALTVKNGTTDPYDLLAITSPGLAADVRGGVPVRVPANGSVVLAVKLSLPACSRLPPPPGRVGSARFGGLQLVFRDEEARVQVAPYVPDPGDKVYPALLALRARICPGTLQRPSGTGRRF